MTNQFETLYTLLWVLEYGLGVEGGGGPAGLDGEPGTRVSSMSNRHIFLVFNFPQENNIEMPQHNTLLISPGWF